MLDSNLIQGNVAQSKGGGVALRRDRYAELTNNMIVDNWAGSIGSGIFVEGTDLSLWHNTIANNTGGDGSGVYVTDNNNAVFSSVALTNSIAVSQEVGITVTAGSAVTLNGTLWYGNTVDRGGAGTIVHNNDRVGKPQFVDPLGGNYHLSPGSFAVDAGVNTVISTDIDGELRPQGTGSDLGADELLRVTISLDGDDIRLDWIHGTMNGSYELWRSTTPYFTPGDSGSSKLAEVMAVGGTASYIDTGAAVSSDSYYYVIVALPVYDFGNSQSISLTGRSSQVGKFTIFLSPE